MNKPKILIVDDSREFVDVLQMLLKEDFDCACAYSGEEGLEIYDKKNFDVILLDIEMEPGIDGYEFLQTIKERDISIPVIMISKHESIDMVVKAIKMGAYDYIGKKPDLSELKIVINRALADYGRRRKNQLLEEDLQRFTGDLVGHSEAMLEVKQQIAKLAQIDSTVLITGETGTGKELVVRQIHRCSPRKDQPFIAVNCAAIPKELFESELFGHEKGAFTGAFKRKPGRFEQADKGTLFLDEISEIDKFLQAKLLRVLEEREFQRVGGEENIQVDIRLIAATNKDLNHLIDQGLFRNDLYFRLNIGQIHIPPLRERKTDIPMLVAEFIKKKNHELKKKVKHIADDTMNKLLAYDWPGNVRELQNLIERAIINADGDTLYNHHFPEFKNDHSSLPNYETAKQQAIARFQKEYISAMLHLTEGNISEAAARMEISRQGLYKMKKQLGIDPAHF